MDPRRDTDTTTPPPLAAEPRAPQPGTTETETESTMDTDRPGDPPAVADETSPEAPDPGPETAPTPGTAAPGPTSVWTDGTGSTPEQRDRGVRVGTVVWGLVVAAIGVGLIASVAGVQFDVELAVIGLIAAAGLALLVGSVAKSVRRKG